MSFIAINRCFETFGYKYCEEVMTNDDSNDELAEIFYALRTEKCMTGEKYIIKKFIKNLCNENDEISMDWIKKNILVFKIPESTIFCEVFKKNNLVSIEEIMNQ